jgi:hypothetical protein
MESKWLEFERLIKNIQQTLAPEAKVSHNQLLRGKSGVEHQCDVVLSANIGQYPFLCIIEAKDWKKRVGIEVIRDFWGKIDDIGAMQGVIVSGKGFTKKAERFASKKGIILYKLIDAQSVKWKNEALLPIQITQINLKSVSGRIIDSRTNEPMSPERNGEPIIDPQSCLFDAKANRYLKYKEFFEQEWDEKYRNKVPSPDEDSFQTESNRYFFCTNQERQFPIIIQFRFIPEVIYYYGRLSLTKCRGFIDQKTNNLFTDYLQTRPLFFTEALKTWPSTKDQNKVPFKASLYFWTVQSFSDHPNTPEGLVIRACNPNLTAPQDHDPNFVQFLLRSGEIKLS